MPRLYPMITPILCIPRPDQKKERRLCTPTYALPYAQLVSYNCFAVTRYHFLFWFFLSSSVDDFIRDGLLAPLVLHLRQVDSALPSALLSSLAYRPAGHRRWFWAPSSKTRPAELGSWIQQSCNHQGTSHSVLVLRHSPISGLIDLPRRMQIWRTWRRRMCDCETSWRG
jgi:hypothetical protein